MKLECTRKLLDFLKTPHETTPQESAADPIFSWTANIITLNRRKVIVAVNQATRCMFLLYGLTAKNLSDLPELIHEGIRTMLRSEYVRPEIIEKYLDDCGRMVSFVPNSSRSAAAVCTKACERAEMFSELFDAKDMFQQKLLPWLNESVVAKERYACAHELLIAQLRKIYGDDIQACRAVELEVELELDSVCRRTLTVPADLNFYQLHSILQGAFEWKDCHLHQFVLKTDRYGRPMKTIQLPDGEDDFFTSEGIDCLDSTEADIGTIMAAYGTIGYEYDFGDGWAHTIKLVRVIDDCATPYPRCTEAVGDAPMEDCGGPGGFAEVIKAMNDPGHPEHKEICEWVRGTWWHSVDIEAINRRIRNSYRMYTPVYYDEYDE